MIVGRTFAWAPRALLSRRGKPGLTTRPGGENTPRVSVPVRSPRPLACADGLHLSSELVWIDCRLVPGERYRLRAITEGSPETEDVGALIRFDMADGSAGGEGLRMSKSVGAHFYLRTGPGLQATDRIFTVESPSKRLGVRAWGDRGPVEVKTLTVEKVEDSQPTAFFFSFDVEAAQRRAASKPVDTLVWGKVDGGEYGIRRICDVLEQHGLRGNFLIDFATCGSDGDAGLRRIVDFLAGRGHEIHMHLHPAGLVRSWGLRGADGGQIHFDTAPYDLSRRLLEFTVSRYEEFVGQPPRLFRSGAYRMNADLVLAAGSLGIEALSNVRPGVVGQPSIGGDAVDDAEPFAWENGVLEIPVDSSSPEAGRFEDYVGKYEAAVHRKSHERTFNIVMHSFSLLRRNAEGMHDTFAPEYEETFHRMCQHAAEHGTAYGYGEYLDARRLPRPVISTARIQAGQPDWPGYLTLVADGARCTICDGVFARSRADSDHCPWCGLGPRHRQLRQVLDRFGNVLDGRRVLTFQATPAERRAFYAKASELVDLAEEGVEQPKPAELSAIEAGSVDCFMGLHLSAEWVGEPTLREELARILEPGGVFVAALPEQVPAAAASWGVGGTNLARATADFAAWVVPGYDAVTNTWQRICLAYRQ